MAHDQVGRRSLVLDPGLDKLQACLLAMSGGEDITVHHAVDVSGLPREICERVFEALVRAGLMTRLQDGRYVRAGATSSQLES